MRDPVSVPRQVLSKVLSGKVYPRGIAKPADAKASVGFEFSGVAFGSFALRADQATDGVPAVRAGVYLA